jgi:integrase/recombinase XerD
MGIWPIDSGPGSKGESLSLEILGIRGQSKKDRVIPVGERAVAWLDKYLDQARPRLVTEPDDGTLFLTAQGEPFGPNRLSGLVRDYVEAAGISKHGACHLFRHTMATLMLEGGADIRSIQQMLGHARLDTTQVYTHVSIRMLKQIHSATHPAAQLKRGSPNRDPEGPEWAIENAVLAQAVQGQMWPGVPASTAEELFAALDEEFAEEDQD